MSTVIKTALEPITLRLGGMTCTSSVATIERALNAIPEVSATVNFASETAHIMAPADMDSKVFFKAIKSAGYSAEGMADRGRIALHSKKSARSLIFSALFTIPVLAISMTTKWHPAIDRWVLTQLDNLNLAHPKYSPTSWLLITLSAPVVLLIAWPIHRAGIRNLKHPTVDTLVSLGSLTAFGWSIYANISGAGDVNAEVSATIILFVIAGRFLGSRAKRRAGSAISTLLALASREVSVRRDGAIIRIPIDRLVVGDEFLAKPGERIATDGIVISGMSSVDTSLLTGESKPVDIDPGDHVIGSSLNRNGRLMIRATRVGSDTELARITAMAVSVQGAKTPIQRRADRISAISVSALALLSLATFFLLRFTDHTLTDSISTAIALLVIASPCALGLATPAALLVASGRGAQRGIVIRDPGALEVAKKIDSVILDKTGTLTNGPMSVLWSLVLPSAGKPLGIKYSPFLNESVILSTAYSIENESDNPVAAAIVKSIKIKGIETRKVTHFESTPGSGSAGRVELGPLSPAVLIGAPVAVAHSTVPFDPELQLAIDDAEEDGLTVSVLAWEGVALAVFAVGDEINPDAQESVLDLKNHGIDPWLVTGDSERVAIALAEKVGIDLDHIIAGALPKEKIEQVKKLQAQGRHVLMIGDGVSDAPALATADLSIAMGTGTDTAIATSDIVLMRRDLGGVIDALNLSRKTVGVIRTNLAWAFLYNVIGIPLAAMGLIPPMYAAGAMALSNLVVVINSLRIK
ncbi:MAG: heavy metal translocating P-type ATPase [Actinobacteria bacterium]|nr:heavy metal translocating P-type ATPase [Actinomycetota bacterium]